MGLRRAAIRPPSESFALQPGTYQKRSSISQAVCTRISLAMLIIQNRTPMRICRLSACVAIACAATWYSVTWLVPLQTTHAAGADGITGLPADVTPILSLAGIWQPVDDQYINQNCNGTLANTFTGNFTTDSSGREHIIATGWQYCGFNNTATVITPVHFAIFRQQNDGTMKLDTASFVFDSLTNGGGSVVVADFNGDGYPDIFLAAHNESPFIAAPSTALLSNGTGGLTKVTLSDHVMAHDAELATINGVPTVITATFQPGDLFPLYQFRNGAFTQISPPVLSGTSFGAPNISYMSMALDDFAGAGKYEAIFGDFLFGPGVPYTAPLPGNHAIFQIGVYPFDGTDINRSSKQLVSGYFNSRSQYANVNSNWGPGNTHTYRVKVDDFNHDGWPDVIGLASLWDGTGSFPAAVQMLQNDGTGKFQDVIDTLAANVNTQIAESDYTLQVRDLDGSGINSYASAAANYPTPFANMTDYLWVNDGTGRLYVALFSQFTAWANQVNAYAQRAVPDSGFNEFPKFILYRAQNGKYNLLALVAGQVKKNGVFTEIYAAVNVPLQIDLATMYTAPMVVQNRNGSHLIRTFAGDDTVYSGNNGGYSKIDGGLGTNTVVYAGPARNYSATKNGDGSWTVKDNVGADGTDTLIRIQRLQFSDTVVRLDAAGGPANAPVITAVVNGASFQPGIVVGSWVTIQGQNLAGVSRTWNAADFGNGAALPTNLSGVQVSFNGQPAAIYYVSPTQLNVQTPANQSGAVSVQVQYFGTSNSFSATATQSSPGLFTYQRGSNLYPAAVYNDTSILVGDPAVGGSGVRKAQPGDIVLLYATGIEPSPAGAALNAPLAVQSQITVTIGPQSATVLGAALVYPGEFQINIVVPNVPDGDNPLKLSVGSQSSQSGVIIPIGR